MDQNWFHGCFQPQSQVFQHLKYKSKRLSKIHLTLAASKKTLDFNMMDLISKSVTLQWNKRRFETLTKLQDDKILRLAIKIHLVNHHQYYSIDG